MNDSPSNATSDLNLACILRLCCLKNTIKSVKQDKKIRQEVVVSGSHGNRKPEVQT